jgi:hypothetical protein
MNQKDADIAEVRKHIEQLLEHFETVQIFCTRYNPNKTADADEERTTTRLQMGSGNWFARVGHVVYWLEEVKEEARVEKRDEE